MRHIISRVRRHTPTLSILLIVFSSIVGVAVILSSSLISNKNAENRSKAADGTARTVKLVNRPYDGTSKYFLFDGIIENGVTIEQNSNRFTYSGNGWTQGFQTSLASGGSTSYTGGADDAVTFTTTYDEFMLITYKGQGYGSFEVYVDGQYRETIDTAASTANWQVHDTIQLFPLTAESKLPTGSNVITLTNIPQGTNTYFLFDGIIENGQKVEQNSSRFTYSGSWTRDSANALASGGSSSYTNAADGSVSFTTTASIVTLITNLGPGYGSMRVQLNGQDYGTLYNTGPSSIRWQYKYTLPIGLSVVRPSPPVGAKLVKLVNKPSGTNAYVLFDGITDSGIFYNDDSYRVQYQSVAQQPSTNVWNYSVLLPLARGGTAAYTGGSGDSVSFYTTSPEVQLTTYKGPGHGSYDLYVDNQFKQNIPLTAATGVWQTTITLPISPIQPVSGEKTVRIVNHPLDDTNKNIIFDGISENGRVTQEDSQRFTYSGTWTSYGTSTASGGSLKYATTPSAEVQFKTTADEVKIITYKGPTYGAFDVYVDGVRKQTVRTLATDTTWKYETTISLAAPPAGSKQVRLVNKPLGTGAAYMLFDGIVENNTPIEQDSPRFSYLGTGWTSVTTAAASGNSTIYTANQGDEVLFYTTANTITLTSYKGPSYGSIDVYIDGVYRENIIMLGSTAQWRYAIPLQISPLPTPPAGSKQVRLVNRPTSSAAKYFFFDAIGENTTYTQQDDRRFTYVGSGWNKAIVGTGYSAGTASLGSFDGDEVSFYTTSPEVAVYTAKGPLYGSLDVYVDGVLRQNIRLTDATASLTPLYIAVDPDAISAADQRTKRLRVLEVRYFPPGVPPLYEPDVLSSELRSLLSSASRYRGYANPTAQPAISVEIVQVINRYTARPNPNNTWYKTTEAILAQDNLCKIIHDKDIDQIWLWVDPRTGVDTAPGLEYIHSGNYFKTGSAILDSANPPFCNGQDSFVVMGFDDSRTSDLALHSFGHYMESLISNVLGSDLFWNRYAGNNATNRALRCGNVHFPPNGAADYDYSNETYVQTSCEDWNPDATGTKKTYNCSRWGCTQGGYLVWWMQNFPNINNPFIYNGKKIPNWWDFTVDFDDAVQSYKRLGYHLNTSFFSLKYAPNLALDSVSTKMGSGSLPDSWVHTTQGSKRLFTVQVSYQAKTDPQAKVNTLSYAGKPMTFIRRDKNGDTTNEIWQLLNPPEGSYLVSATFTASLGDYVFIGTSFGGVNQTTPMLTHASNSGSSVTQSLQLSGSTGSLAVGFVTTYPDRGTNLSQSTIGTSQWSQITSPRNIQSNGVLLPGGTVINFSWNTPKVNPWTSSGFVVSPTRSLEN